MGRRNNQSAQDNATSGLNTEDEAVSSNIAGAPVPHHIGEDKTTIRWLTPIYGQRVIKVPAAGGKKSGGGGKKGGSSQMDEYHGTFAGALGIGPAWSLEWIDVGGKRVWEGGITKPVGDYSDLDLVGVGAARFYWGTETQVADPTLDGYETQPGYRGEVYIVFNDCKFGSNGETSIPTIEVCWRRIPEQSIITGGAAENDGAATANPIACAAEMLTSWHWGNQSSAIIDATSFQATADALYAEAVADTNRHYTSIAPHWNSQTELREALAEIASISKAWFRIGSTGLIECGRWKRDGSLSGVTALTHHDCDRWNFDISSSDDLPNSFVVEYRNAYKRHNADTATANNMASIRHTGLRRQTAKRPMLTYHDQAYAHATELLRDQAVPENRLSLQVRRTKSYHSSGQPIRPGDYFTFPINEPGETSDVRLFRCTRRSFEPFGLVEITGELETNGAVQALPATTAVDDVLPVTPPIAYSRVLAISPATADDQPGVAVLAAQPSDTADYFAVEYCRSSGGDFDEIGNSTTFALPLAVEASFSDVASTLRVKLLTGANSIDLKRGRLTLTNWNEGDVAARDDRLLIVLLRKDGSGNIILKGDGTQWVEILSVSGPATSVSTDVYDVPVLRGRLGTIAAAFTAGSFPDTWSGYEAWCIPKEGLGAFLHPDFGELIDDDDPAYFRLVAHDGAGTYDPTTAYTERTRRVSESIALEEFVNQASGGVYYPAITYDFPAERLAPLFSGAAAAARSVKISANSSFFSKPAGTDVYAPSTITLTATVYNISSPTYQWAEYVEGTGWVDISGETSSTLVIGNTDFADKNTYQVSVGSPAVKDQMTIVKIADGTGYRVQLTNESQIIICNSAGTPNAGQLGSGGTAFTDVNVWRNATALTGSLAIDPPTAGNFYISVSGATGGAFTVVDGNTVRCDSMSADEAYCTISVKMELGLQVQPVLFTCTKSKAGADGSGYNYTLTMPAPQVRCDSAGTAIAGELSTGGRVRTNVFVYKSGTLLTATASTPTTGQYRVLANGTPTNCTATFSSGYVIRLDTATADTGLVPYRIELEGTSNYFDLDWNWIKTLNGATGSAGLNNAVATLYKRAFSTPALPSTTATYTFATGVLTGHNNSWTQAIPAVDGNPLWATAATASSTGATDTIASGEWAAAVKILEDGTDGTNGLSVATVYLFQRAASLPSVPGSTLTFTFSTGVLSGTLGSWTQSVPAGSNPCYVTTATAASTGSTDTISSGEWATPQILAQNGSNGTNGAGYGGTSSTSLSLGTGSKTLTTQTGLAYLVGDIVRLKYVTDPAQWMEGAVTAYNSGTGSLTFTSAIYVGVGTYSSWNLSLAGQSGTGGVYVGDWSAGGLYYVDSVRQDIVTYSGTYYRFVNPAKNGSATTGQPNISSDWASAGTTLKFTATKLGLLEDAVVTKTLTMGDGATSNAGIIRSAAATAHMSGDGFYFNPRNSLFSNAATFRVGNPSAYYIAYDGTDLRVNPYRLIVGDSGGTDDTVGLLQVVGEISDRKFGSGAQNVGFTGTVAQGTITSPSATASGSFTALRMRGYYGSGYATGASLRLKAAAAWSGSSNATEMELLVANLAGTGSNYLYYSSEGKLEFGGTTGTRDNANWYRGGTNSVKSDGTVEAGAFKQTYLEAGVTTAVDVKDVNLRIYSGGTQNARIDYTTGYYYVQGNKVVGLPATGWTTTPSGTLTRTTFNTATVTHTELAERVAALINDLHVAGTANHGILKA